MKYVFIITVLASIGCSPRIAPDAGWGHQRWILTEMKGVPVQLSGGRRDAHLNFNPVEKTFAGNGGCNQISGGYTLDKKTIHFNDVIATKMSCPDIEFENAFISELGRVDRYELRGNDLLLKKKREVLLRLSAR